MNLMKSDRSMENGHEERPSLALHIVPPLHSNNEHSIALEATMQSLVLDQHHPIALELAGTAQNRSFIVRATTQTALDNVEALLRAQYPQGAIYPVKEHEDPFHVGPDEAITAVELLAGGASFLPLRTWQEAQSEGSDPLLSLLSALGHLPEGTRVISQLALMSTVSNWSRANLRRAIENPLEPERRAKERERMVAIFSASNGGNILLINMAVIAGVVLLIRPLLPSWMMSTVIQLALGGFSKIPPAHLSQLALLAAGLIILEIVILVLYGLYGSFMKRRALYDPNVVAQKVSRMAYRTRLRLYAIGPKTRGNVEGMTNRLADTRAQAKVREELLLRMVAAYRQFHMANGAFFVPKRIPDREVEQLLDERAIEGGGWQKGLTKSHHMIGVDSLASLWHMPHPQALPELALVEHRRSRTLLIPPTVTELCQGRTPIGYSEHAGYRLPFALTPEFFTFHTLISGKSGEGKSVFMQHIAQEAMLTGGMVLIDPFGDLCESVLQLVPPNRIEDVVFIDLSDTHASVGLNPLDVTLGHRRDKFISDLMKMLSQLWASSWTPSMENAFEMSLRTLFEANRILIEQDPQRGPSLQYTLLDILPLLTNINFCHTLLQQIQDDYLHRWWREYYEPLSSIQQREVINPIAAKVAKFESLMARRILGQNVSTLHIPHLIEQRKIILFKLARGVVGNEVTSMVGAALLALIQNTLEEQGEPKNMGTTRFPIIIDEFQRVTGADYRTLSEVHKYGATFFLATQSLEYLQKINPLLWPTLQANIRQMVAFNMSIQDADILHQELGVDQDDILHLDINTCYVSVLAGGRRQPTFSLKLKSPASSNAELAESIRTRCRIRYTLPVAEVDKKLSESMLRSIRMAPAPDPQSSQLPPASPVPALPQAHERRRNPVSSSPLAPLPKETLLEGAEYRQRRERSNQNEGAEYRQRRERGNQDESLRLESYQARKEEWSTQEDIHTMGENK